MFCRLCLLYNGLANTAIHLAIPARLHRCHQVENGDHGEPRAPAAWIPPPVAGGSHHKALMAWALGHHRLHGHGPEPFSWSRMWRCPIPVSNQRHAACKARNSYPAHFQSMRSTFPQPVAPAGSEARQRRLHTPSEGAAAGFGATDQANGRPLQGQPRPLRVLHSDTRPIAATTRPPAPISHQKVSGSWNWRRIQRRRTSCRPMLSRPRVRAASNTSRWPGSHAARRRDYWLPSSESRAPAG